MKSRCLYCYEDTEELALTLEGKKKKLKKEHFEKLGKDLGLTPKQIKGAFNRMLKTNQTHSTG